MDKHFSQYSAWVRAHADDARRTEDLLRLASMLAPGFGGGARSLLGEVLYSVTNVLTLTHDMILDTRRTVSADASLRMVLSILASIDIVVEVTAWRLGGRRTRLHAIFLVEVTRAVLKTLVLARSAERFLLRGGQYALRGSSSARDAQGQAASVEASSQTPMAEAPPEAAPEAWWRGGLTGITIPMPPDYAAATALSAAASSEAAQRRGTPLSDIWQLLRSAMHAFSAEGAARGASPSTFRDVPRDVPADAACDEHARPLRLVGELLHIWRPTVFAALRLMLGGRSWIPLLAAGAADIASARLSTMACEVSAGLPGESFVPRYTLEALANTCAQLGAAWHSFFKSPPLGLSGSPSVEGGVVGAACSPSADTAAASAFVTPPGGSPEGALLAALAAPKAGLAGVAIRAALWLFSSPPGLSLAEEAELQRRRALWAFYLLRSPLFYAVTKPVTDGAASAAAYVPLLGSLAAYGASVLQYVQEHQMYTAASQG